MDMGEVIVDGKVVGDISVQKVSLRGHAEVHGNITCKSLCVDPTVIVVGGLNVHPGAPETLVNEAQADDEQQQQQQQQQHDTSVSPTRGTAPAGTAAAQAPSPKPAAAGVPAPAKPTANGVAAGA
eukprot:TRINITY_DN632_c0_g1_i5.p1 TRINITY_DN632_c0_g1~~TRINITY_DN632_c0_g1_i5.p1  ORF type:complete len:125 (-),score=38.37 TRINITY_DN632_c0_g1_i5:158-532(-)